MPASRKQLRNGRKWSQVFSITDEFRSLGCSVEEWWGLWSQERTCLQNVQQVMVPKQAWLQQKSVSGQHGAVQRKARGYHVKKQPWSRPEECMSVLRMMLQNMEKFTSWSVEKKWGPVASWEVWQAQERMQGMWGGFVWADSNGALFKTSVTRFIYIPCTPTELSIQRILCIQKSNIVSFYIIKCVSRSGNN